MTRRDQRPKSPSDSLRSRSANPLPPQQSKPDDSSLQRRIAQRFSNAKRVEQVAADASTRRFFRLKMDDGSSRIVMLDPEGGVEALARMKAAGELMQQLDVPVPAVLDHETELQALVFEDFGDRLLADLAAQMSAELLREKYAEAARVISRIELGTKLITPKHALASTRLGRERLRIELAFFAVHDVANRRGLSDRALLGELSLVLDRIARELDQHPARLAHRDMHARNLLIREDGSLGLLDFQDALLAPIYYDLVSLIYDPYVALVDESLRRHAVDAYREAAKIQIDPLEDPRLAWVGLQRMLKALGTYSYQLLQRNNGSFEQAIPVAESNAMLLAEMIQDKFRVDILEMLSKLGFKP